METIDTKQLADEAVYPDEQILRGVLGASYDAYGALLELYERMDMHWEWRYYQDGKAWLCKVQRKKRTIVWMSAWKGYMQATVYIPERLLDQVYALPIQEKAKARIRNTKNVGRSKPCIFEIHDTGVLKDLETVMDFKITAK